MYYVLFAAISLIASTIGAIAGIGGGVIIKPALDSFNVLSVSAISFLSGCTVLSMSCYSVGCALISKSNYLQPAKTVPLGIGAAIGGVVGKEIFKQLTNIFARGEIVGAIQSACLLLVTILTFVYTLLAGRIQTRSIRNKAASAGIGLGLGMLSSFLGIGGGPINLMVLGYFFSMNIRTAAQNSLLVIFISQIASLLTSLLTRTVPEFSWLLLALMACGGIGGGILGRMLNKRMNAGHVRKLFCATMVIIIILSARNFFLYIGA